MWVAGIKFAPGMAGMIELVFSSPMFYLSILLVPAVAIIPDVTLKCLKTVIRPTVTDCFKFEEMQHKNGNPSERSSLLTCCFDQQPSRLNSFELNETERRRFHHGSVSSTYQRAPQKSVGRNS